MPRSKKNEVPSLALSEWEQAIKEAVELTSSGEGVTVAELAERTGSSKGMIRNYLLRLIREGKARPTSCGKSGVSIAGRACRVPSYVLVKKK